MARAIPAASLSLFTARAGDLGLLDEHAAATSISFRGVLRTLDFDIESSAAMASPSDFIEQLAYSFNTVLYASEVALAALDGKPAPPDSEHSDNMSGGPTRPKIEPEPGA